MAWVKIPAEHHPIFQAALPKDPRISIIPMFGGICAKVNGYMMAGLFARSALVRLSPADQKAALGLDGSTPFDPMGNGRVMRDTILLPDDVMADPAELRAWLARAFEFTMSLPAKAAGKRMAKPAAAKPAAKPRAAKPAAKPRAAKPAAKRVATPAVKPHAKPAATPRAATPAAKPHAATSSRKRAAKPDSRG